MEYKCNSYLSENTLCSRLEPALGVGAQDGQPAIRVQVQDIPALPPTCRVGWVDFDFFRILCICKQFKVPLGTVGGCTKLFLFLFKNQGELPL